MNRIIKTSILIAVSSLSLVPSFAKENFECRLYLYKNTCWKNYSVSVKVLDPYDKSEKSKASVTVKKDKGKSYVKFPCNAREYVSLEAKFSPTIWEGKENEVYQSKKTWVIPTEIHEDALDWRINICFPGDFQGVPQPTGELRDCKCQREVINTVDLDEEGNPIAGTENKPIKKK